MNVNRFYKSSIIKWSVFLTLLLSVTIAGTSISLFYWYERSNIELYSETTQVALQNVSSAFEAFETSIMNVGFLAVNDAEYRRMMTASSIDMVHHLEMQNRLNHFRLINSSISSAVLVNPRADWIIGTPFPDVQQIDVYIDLVNYKVQGGNAIARINTYRTVIGGREMDVVTYVFYLSRSPHLMDSFLMINVQHSVFGDILNTMDTIDRGELVVLDENGIIVFSQDLDRLYSHFGYEYVLTQITMQGQYGAFLASIGEERHLITYVKSSVTGYTFIVSTPYSTVRSAANALRGRSILVSVAVLFVGILGALLLARHFYGPLRRLVEKHILNNPQQREWIDSQYSNEYELIDKFFEDNFTKFVSLDSFIDENIPIVRQDHLKKLLEGQIRLGQDFAHKALKDIGIAFAHEYFQVVIISVDNAKDDCLLPVKREIGELAQELLCDFCTCEAVWNTVDDNFALILNHRTHDIDKNELEKRLRQLQVRAKNITIAIGYVIRNKVQESNKNAAELLMYKIKYGSNAFLTLETILEDIDGSNQFPEMECNQLLAELKGLSVEGSTEAVKNIIQKFYRYNMNDIIQSLDHILYKVLFALQGMIKGRDVLSNRDFFYNYEMLTEYKSLQELEEKLFIFLTGVISDFKRALIEEKEEESDRGIKHILDFIRNDYRNPSLSLEYVADYAKLSPSYLGSIFYERMGLHFPEYVSRLRLEAAKELLVNTSESVNHIARLVGFNSASYFITCFKKYTGVTPAKYR
ncbi:MAG: helix-turn-helix domain-containing protein [Defluviitaleaceae bacterium]|nr:helix-turn-helix domain-containing protein [Defluviitaleaceae bacterium]